MEQAILGSDTCFFLATQRVIIRRSDERRHAKHALAGVAEGSVLGKRRIVTGASMTLLWGRT